MRGDGYGFVVTENGIADSQDLLRPAYLLEHLLALRAAQRRASPLAMPMRLAMMQVWWRQQCWPPTADGLSLP